jgi:hypothetical protein
MDEMEIIMRKLLIGFLSVVFCCQTTNADIDCTGTVAGLSLQMTNTGVVTVSLSGGPTAVYLCAVDGAIYNGVSPEVCKAMYSTLMAAKLSNKKMLIRFSGNYAKCSDIPSWAAAPMHGWTGVFAD